MDKQMQYMVGGFLGSMPIYATPSEGVQPAVRGNEEEDVPPLGIIHMQDLRSCNHASLLLDAD